MDRRTFLRSMLALTASMLPLGAMPPKASALEPTNPKDAEIKDYLNRMRHFDNHFENDQIVSGADLSLLDNCVRKMRQVESLVGYGRFTILSYPTMLALAKKNGRVESFTSEECDFLHQIFYTDASRYGFLGRKTVTDIEQDILDVQIQRMPGTPHYLFRGVAMETFERLKREMGDELVLTSGVRGVVKQMMLFLGKAQTNRGNLSLASRQLAPPGYSFHGVGDLDVGKAGLGAENFTERFMTTDVYQKLSERGYLSLRYPQDNMLGVRFEPWHIKVVDWI